MLVVDNGPELRGRELERWAHDHGVKLFFIDPLVENVGGLYAR